MKSEKSTDRVSDVTDEGYGLKCHFVQIRYVVP